jgi:murein DD-endopeptidase MepM/ murein hydrolase activator NlpD
MNMPHRLREASLGLALTPLVLLVALCCLLLFTGTGTALETEGTVQVSIDVSTAEPDALGTAPTEPAAPTPPPTVQFNEAPGRPETMYTVVRGDSLSAIAKRFLGDPMRYWELVEANKHRYPSITKNPDLIHPGWELIIPGSRSQAASSPYSEATPGIGIVRVDTSLNIRSGPWGSIIGSFNDADTVDIIGQEGDWYKIRHNGGVAYVHVNYIHTATRAAGTTPVNNPHHDPDPTLNTPSGDNEPVTPGAGRFGAAPCSPMPTRVSSEFGWRTHPTLGTRRHHDGIDLPIPNGTRLNALGDGTVIATGYESGGGRYIRIRYDNGLESFYCHLQSVSVRPGQRVAMGQEVSRSDNTGAYTTGAHLHMGIKRNGVYINPRSTGIPLPR